MRRPVRTVTRPPRFEYSIALCEVRQRLAQQEGVALHRRGIELEAEVDVAGERLAQPCIGLAASDALEVDRRGRRRARLGAREREQLVREAAGAHGRAVHLLELRAAGVRHRLRDAGSVCACSPAGGVRSWCAAVRGTAWLRLAADLLEQAVQRAHQRPRLLRSAGGVDRPQVAAERDLISSDSRASGSARASAEPDDDQRRERDQEAPGKGAAECRARGAPA